MPDYRLEQALAEGADRAGGARVVGLDEAGRGPWAGPVVAAAVWLDPAQLPGGLLDALDDSKKLTRARRETLFAAMTARAGTGLEFAIGQAGVEEIDRLNILQASLLAMTRAAAGLGFRPDAALVDGNRAPDL
ncbi:MAG: ribonuclease HII, partial [Kiloniellales bacterium]